MNIVINPAHIPFLLYESYGAWLDASQHIIIFYCKFNKDGYENKLFQKLQVNFPNTIKNSFAKRKVEFLAGRYCANKVLEAVGIYNFTVHTGEHRSPQWPDNILGTISHSHDHAVAAS